MPDGVTALDDKYSVRAERVHITGTQALVRLLLEQHRRDRAAGLRTAGYVTGYRGSPLGALDLELTRSRSRLDAHDIRFQPGVNEDLAATALWGTQQIHLFERPEWDGVFGVWYGKGPGVDRSGDALRHANLAGTAANGGVLLLAGDDHTCKSSTTSHQSEFALVDAMIPVLHPATVSEIIEYGLHGFALSRYSGCWAGMKVTADLTDRTTAITLDPALLVPARPSHALPPGGVGIRWPDTPQEQEERLHLHKIPAARAYLRAAGLDRVAFGDGRARFGIVATGKAYLDVVQALGDLGIDQGRACALGIAVYKVACTWPLETDGLRRFADGLTELLVVEEKRPLVEAQVKDALYNLPPDRRPRVTGKTDEAGAPLLKTHDELNPAEIAAALAARLARLDPSIRLSPRAAPRPPHLVEPAPKRTAYFCSGCPHSSSTVVPEGSRALAGIGCHYMAQWMERRTDTYTHMGAEGASWIGQAPFVPTRHVFQNIGDGTYFHSGLLAIRAAVAAGVTMTYKILFNDAVAMTGGQRHDGQLTPQAIAWQVRAEGVQRIAVVSDEPHKYEGGGAFPPYTTVHGREELDAVQRELREVSGVSALIYDQTCATEKRRRRKRGLMPDPGRVVVINESVCEACGDCSRASNCLSVVPVETAFGTKRQIDQTSCNKDATCTNGFCPSFVTLEGGRPAPAPAADQAPDVAGLPVPDAALDRPYDILVAGVGGTGVVTVGAILGMAAHLEGKAFSILDQTGLAQKGGAVLSHIRLAPPGADIAAARIPSGGADLVLGCDPLVAAGRDSLDRMAYGRTRAVLNAHEAISGDFTRKPEARRPREDLAGLVEAACGAGTVMAVDATKLATALLGDGIAANLFLVGFAWQKGFVPLGADAIDRAIALNGTAVALNRAAFAWGRHAAEDLPTAASGAAARSAPGGDRTLPADLDALIRRHEDHLAAYQDQAYAARYRRFVERVRSAEQQALPGSVQLTEAVARTLWRLMAYKDEYEVARLHTDPEFLAGLARRVEGGRLRFHLAPPLLAGIDPATGHPRKRAYGPWILHVFRVLARMKRLRGTPLDPFGHTTERRMERRLVADYQATVQAFLDDLDAGTLPLAARIASVFEQIKGYGHVKLKAVHKAEAEQAELLAQFRSARRRGEHRAANGGAGRV